MNTPTQTLSWHDLQWCLTRCPRKLLEEMKKQGPKIMVAGGYIRSCIAHEPVNDVDVFVPTKEYARQLALDLVEGNLKKIHETDNAFTLRGFGLPIQIIHRWTFEFPSLAIQSFDFTVARAAFWSENQEWRSICDARFYPDLAGKRLIYCHPVRIEECGGSMLRVLKFYQRGYRIPLDSLAAVIARLMSGVTVTDRLLVDAGRKTPCEKFNEPELARVLSGFLREVDPSIDPKHISHLPSEPSEPDGEQA